MKKLIEPVKSFVRFRPKMSIIILVVFIAVFTFVNIEVLHYTSEPGFCEMCHSGTDTGALSEVHTWRQNIHADAGVYCLDCHGKPGLFGYKRAKIGGLYDVYAEIVLSEEEKLEILNRAVEDPAYADNLVPSNTCLFCHTDSVNQQIRRERIMSVGVKFRELDGIKNPEFRQARGMRDIYTDELKSDIDPNHQKHMAAGLTCMDCHHGMSHSGEYRQAVDLNRCSECHRERAREISMSDLTMGEGESAVNFRHSTHGLMFSCDQCHQDLFPMKAGASTITFADHTTSNFCYSCHDGKRASYDCNSCHSQTPAPADLTMGEGDSAVTFRHSTHGAMFSCDKCHMDLFPMEAGTSAITFADHTSSNFCYSCHNGRMASYNCNSCHAKVPAPQEPITYTMPGFAPVDFNHRFHGAVFSCDTCHPEPWEMQAHATKMTMNQMYQGQFCGTCHNGQAAFAATACVQCHK